LMSVLETAYRLLMAFLGNLCERGSVRDIKSTGHLESPDFLR
jgi:hypothetical protein